VTSGIGGRVGAKLNIRASVAIPRSGTVADGADVGAGGRLSGPRRNKRMTDPL